MDLKEITLTFEYTEENQKIDIFEMVTLLKQVFDFASIRIEQNYAGLTNEETGVTTYIDEDEVEFTFSRWSDVEHIIQVQNKDAYQDLFLFPRKMKIVYLSTESLSNFNGYYKDSIDESNMNIEAMGFQLHSSDYQFFTSLFLRNSNLATSVAINFNENEPTLFSDHLNLIKTEIDSAVFPAIRKLISR